MSSSSSRKTAAGFASGFLAVTALLSVLVALMFGLGQTGTGSNQAPQSRIGARR